MAIEHLGFRGKPVRKLRMITVEKALALARKLQGTRGCTASEI
ncbi:MULTISPECIES: hypothetical protein [Aphanothece]